MPKKRSANVDPIDEALDAQAKLAAKTREADVALWEAWRSNPTATTLAPLMQRFSPVIRSAGQQYKAPNVSETAMDANLRLQAMNAFETYDPNKAALRTHLGNHLRKSMRFNAQHQNYAYLPEGQSMYIGAIDRAADALRDELGREPTHTEIAAYTRENPDLLNGKSAPTPKLVKTIQGGRRKDILGSSLDTDAATYAASRNTELVGLLRPSLPKQVHPIFDHMYGLNGAPQITNTNALAKRLGMSASQVSRAKSQIAATYKKYL